MHVLTQPVSPKSRSSWDAVFSRFSGSGSRLQQLSEVSTGRTSTRTLRRETLEQRHLLSATSLLTGVSPNWFEYVGDSDTVGHANLPSLSAEMIRDSEDTSTEFDNVNDAFDWIVRFDTKSLEHSKIDSVAKTANLLAGQGMEFEVIRGLGLVGQVLVRSTGVDADLVESWLADNQHVASFELDSLHEIQTTPSDSYYSSLWGLQNNGQTGGTAGADIDAQAAWDISTGNSSIVVGIIDTGVDYTHSDLVSNIWTNPGEIAGNGIDDDGNGFVDDVHGYDFVNNDGDPMDDNNHGTHVAGTIAGAGNNSRGVTGVNWSSSIMGLKFLSESGSGYSSDAVRAVNYATMMRTNYGVNVRVTNNSWGGGGASIAMEDAIQASGDAGILFVAAAGNDGTNNDASPHYPSNYALDNVLSVAATDHNDNLASFSNYGQSTVHLAAPGVSIVSTIAGGGYASFSGTSMATPHVAGVAALAWAVDPEATVAEIRTALLQGTDTLGSLAGKCTTEGRLNAFNTLELLSGDGPAAPVVASLGISSNYITAGTSTTLTARGINDFDGSVSSVSFYSDANGDGLYDEGDTLLTTVSSVTGDEVSYTIATDGMTPGNHTFFARALDNDGQWSATARGTLFLIASDDHGDDAVGASAVTVGDAVAGAIERDGDVDWFAFTATAGGIYRFETTLGSLTDSCLYLYDQDGGTIVEANDDIRWPDNLGSRITWQAEVSGTYYLAVEPLTDGLLGDYTLQLTDISDLVDDHGDDASTATQIAVGDTTGGTLEVAWDQDWFSFQATAGTTYLFDVELVDLGDSELYLYSTNGTSILNYNDDYDFAVDFRSRISWTAEADGTYYLSVHSYCECYSGEYTITAEAVADDHGNSSRTATGVSVGETVAGNIEFGTDVDYFAVDLEAGGHYSFQTSLGSLPDSVLYLYGPGGWEILDYSDDISYPEDPSSRIEWIAETSGTYYVAVESYEAPETGDYTLDVQLLNYVPILEPLGDQRLQPGQDSVDVTLIAGDRDGDALTYVVHVLGTDPHAATASALDQELGLYMHRIGYLENIYGANEKLIASDEGWHFILPNGELHRWEGSISDSALVATLSSRYYLDPALLHDAVEPISPDCVELTLVGDTLTIDPVDGYHEAFSVRVEVTDGSDTVFDTFEVAWDIPDVVDLGAVGYAEVASDPTAQDSQWFKLVTQHDGYLSVEALLEDAGDGVTLRLRNENYVELVTWDSSFTEERLDLMVSAGETYHVEVVGQADLRVANLVQRDGETVIVHGTDGDDRFEFAAGDQYRIAVNGVEYLFESGDVSSVTFDGGAGHDTSVLIGSSANDTIYMRPDSTTLVGAGYQVDVVSVERVDAYGGGGNDRAYLYDSAGDDRFYGRSTLSYVIGDGFFNVARGFDRVDAYATAGGNDRAYLYDSAGDDRFYGRSTLSYVIGDGFFNVARGFDRVDAYATAGGNDRAYLYDSALDDYLEATGNRATLNYGASAVSVSDFAWVQAASTSADDEKCIELIDFALELLGAWEDA